MKNVVCCGRFFTITCLCFNFIMGIMIFYSDSKFSWRESVQNTSLYIRDALSTGVSSHSTHLVDSLAEPMMPSSPTHLYGYVLPYTIYEQQTAAARNLWGLQFWANTVNMKVVEPFYTEHRLSFESFITGPPNPMKFSDLYDIDYWNEQSTQRNCSELVDWDNFVSNAPKKVILVLSHGFKLKSKDVLQGGMLKINDNPDAIVGSRSCADNAKFPEKALAYFKHHGFHFVREVCITFNASTPMTVEEYSHHILGHFSSNEVTVIVAFWQGIRSNRVNLKGITLTNANTVEIGLLPSKVIVRESDRYLQKLNLNSKYFGVMVRIEKVFTHFVTIKEQGSFDEFVDYMLECATGLKDLEQLNIHKRWGRTLSIDLGRFGSVNLQRDDKKFLRGMKRLYDAYFSSIFGNEGWTIKEFEGSFKKYLGTENPVHIAQVQRTIAARSDCLIVVGGESTFQSVAISFYKNFHPDVKQQCIIKHCYYDDNFDFNTFVQKGKVASNGISL